MQGDDAYDSVLFGAHACAIRKMGTHTCMCPGKLCVLDIRIVEDQLYIKRFLMIYEAMCVKGTHARTTFYVFAFMLHRIKYICECAIPETSDNFQ